jgi:hypothetical protein
VLSIGKLTVEQSRYYERQVAQGRDDYHSGRGESPGRWTGAGAESLRLGGRVDNDGFMALMEGRDPGTGERLKRVAGRCKVSAFDLTFSAPKSVSVLFAIGEPVLAGVLVEAHESAVEAARGYLEREAWTPCRGLGLCLGLRARSWRVAAQTESFISAKESVDLQALCGVARPGLEPGTPHFQGVDSPSGRREKACN